MSHAAAQGVVVVDELVRLGLHDLVLAPGSRSAPLVIAAATDERLRVHVRHDERSAGFLALGLARASCRPVAVVTTSGTATANVHPAVVEAHHSRVPLLVLTADRPPELRDVGANQTTEQRALYGGSARWYTELPLAEDRDDAPVVWRSTLCHAWGAATGIGGPPGPVQINCPLREPLADTGDAPAPRREAGARPGVAPRTLAVRRRRLPHPEDLSWLTERIAATPRGALVVGDADLPDVAPLARLAAAAGWPIIAEPTSGVRSGDNAVSTADWLLRSRRFRAAHRPDVALVVGRPVLSRAVTAWLDDAVEQILIDEDGAWIDPARRLARLVVADPAITAGDIADQLPERDSDWLRQWRDAERHARQVIDAALDGGDALSEARVVRDAIDCLPHGGALVIGSSLPVRHLNQTMRPRTGVRVLGNRGASGIDGFVSTAVGIALAHPGPVTAVTGDLSVLHDAGGLLRGAGETAADLVLIILNNGGGAIFDQLPYAGRPDDDTFTRLFATPHDVELASLATVAGVGHRRLDAPDAVPATVAEARAAGGLQLVEARTDRRETTALLRRMEEAVSSVVDED